MRVLGISYGYHDSSVALVEDGKLVEYITEERLTNIKHDANFPEFAINYCLKKYNISANDIDHVTFHEDPFHKFTRVFCSSTSSYPDTVLEFTESTKEWLKKKLWGLSHIQEKLSLKEGQLSYFSHHYSHALTAFMGSGFNECAIFIMDAVGDWSCSSMYKGSWVNGVPQVETIKEISFPNSLGLVYSAVTAYLGFNPNDGESSTMALSSFGLPKYADDFREILGSKQENKQEEDYAVALSYFNFVKYYKAPVTQKFIDRFGPGKPPELKYKFDSLKNDNQQDVSENEQRLADIACSLQLVFEEIVLKMAKNLMVNTGSKNLAYAGGCALNCKLNSKLINFLEDVNVYIPFDPGDGGTSIGTALYVSALEDKKHAEKTKTYIEVPYLGCDAAPEDTIEMIGEFPAGCFEQYGFSSLHKTVCESDEKLAQLVASEIVNDKIIGWYQGRGEAGARALGNRSILINAKNVQLAKKLSAKVKERSSFRPYALSIMDEESENYFEESSQLVKLGKWMQYILKVKDHQAESLRGGLHVDQTTRAHICTKKDNPLFHKLLTEVKKLTGQGAVINTSFNLSGYPIVGGASYALSMFVRTEMDILVIGNTIIEKKK